MEVWLPKVTGTIPPVHHYKLSITLQVSRYAWTDRQTPLHVIDTYMEWVPLFHAILNPLQQVRIIPLFMMVRLE
jgi:hypothetical protein